MARSLPFAHSEATSAENVTMPIALNSAAGILLCSK